MLLTRIKHSAATVTEVIAAAGMLEDDIEPAVVRWFHAKTAALPEQMRRELGVWLDVMRNGSTTPPRSRPRADETIRAQLSFALPTLQILGRHPRLAARDHPRRRTRRAAALRPATRHHRAGPAVDLPYPALPQAGLHQPDLPHPRPRPGHGGPARGRPGRILREALDSPSPARAVITALLAYHAIPMRQLARLQLTDIRGGRLHLDDRVILLAEPVRDRVDAYLTYRAATWPASVNAYLFIHARSWKTTRPVTSVLDRPAARHLRRAHPPGPHLPGSRGHRRRHPRPVRPVRHVHRQRRPLGHHHRPHHRTRRIAPVTHWSDARPLTESGEPHHEPPRSAPTMTRTLSDANAELLTAAISGDTPRPEDRRCRTRRSGPRQMTLGCQPTVRARAADRVAHRAHGVQTARSRARSSFAAPASPAPSISRPPHSLCPLLLQDCHIDEPVNLDEATALGDPHAWLPPAGADRPPAADHRQSGR